MKSSDRRKVALLILLAHAVSPLAGIAADSVAAPSDTVMLGELNVIAVKQEEAIRNEAVAATVIGRNELEQLNTVALKGISDVVPNFYIPDYGSRITSTIYVRGIGARMDQPAVGLNVDNVPYLNKNAYDFDLADIASVEMLRGPQSTLYGRNTIGGLINITTLSPLRWQGWKLMVSGARGNEWKASAGWYHKFSPRIATAVIGSFSYLGGFFTNEYNGKKVDHEKSGALRWKLDWHLSDRVYLQNAASATLLRQGGYPYEYIPTGQISYNDTCFYRRFTFNDGLTLNYRHDRFTLTSITTVQHLDDNMTLDQDFLPIPYFTLTQRQKETGFTEDAVFRGSELSEKYKWVAGAFLFYKHLSMNAPVTFKDSGISSLIESHRNDANPDFPISWYSREFPLNSDFAIPTVGAALYHESSFKTSRWKFTLGIRLDWEQSTLDYHSSCDTGYTIYRRTPNDQLIPERNVDIVIDDSDRLKRSYFNWLPKISVIYDLPLEGENNVYAVLSKGYKAGGFNTQMFSDVLQQRLMNIMGIGSRYDVDDIVGYKPEYSYNYEVGSHLTFPAANLDLDISLFYIDCHDQQLTMFPDGTTTGRIMTNAGRTRSFGAELALSWQPVQALQLEASYGYTNAKFRDFFDGIHDYSGNYVPYAPQNTLFAAANYTFDFRDGFVRSLTLGVDLRGTGKIYWNEQNSVSQSFYNLLGANIELSGKIWSLQVWGKNLTNEDYHTFYFMSMRNEFLQRGRPWQIGATLRFEI